jgi:hypothetical protein
MPAADPTLEARLLEVEEKLELLLRTDPEERRRLSWQKLGDVAAEISSSLGGAGSWKRLSKAAAEIAGPEGEPEAPCPQCGQLPGRQSGEYPCAACGEPTLHDPEGPEGEPPPGTGGNE